MPPPTLKRPTSRPLEENLSASRLLARLTAPVAPLRLDSFLIQYGFAPRKEARQFCRLNDVEIQTHDGTKQPVRLLSGSVKVDPTRIVINDERPAFAGQQLHLIMHKPRGVVCTRASDEGKTVFSLLPPDFPRREPPLSSIGRLDKGASGLLLLTQSGTLHERLASPRRSAKKTYVVSLERPLRGHEAAAFARGGLELLDGHKCAPALLTPHLTNGQLCRVSLHEGRFHQLRRMFAAVGHVVTGIHRDSFAGLSLSESGVLEGQWRLMTTDELRTVLASSTSGTGGAEGDYAAAVLGSRRQRRRDRRGGESLDATGDQTVAGRRKWVRSAGATGEEDGSSEADEIT